MSDAAPMIAACFRHQHPEAFGGEIHAVEWDALQPVWARHPDGLHESAESLPPCDLGFQDARTVEGITPSEGP